MPEASRQPDRPSPGRPAAIALALALVASLAAVRPATTAEATPAADLAWRPIAPIPVARSELGAAVVDGRIYVVGGFGGEARVDRYDPAADAWTRGADLPVGVHHPGVAVLGGIVYVAGGYVAGDHAAVDHVWAYDPAADVWTARAPLPAPRGALGLAALDGRLYAVGGARARLGGPVSAEVAVYDPAADRWSAAPDLPTPREHLAVVAADDRLYAIGGRADGDEGDRFAGAAEVYDPVAGRWSAIPPLPHPRGGLAGVAVAGKVVVLGGERGDRTDDEVDAFDPAAEEWISLPPLPVGRHGLAAAAVGSTLYAITGSLRAGRVENTDVAQALDLAPAP